ncbi:Cytochrome c oxidase protein 20, mitochondrial [Candida viswanathii]|uniref:Cytochrome c oxidase assembly protein COX20, mitochondrial n=1 Tax=Candida viswanathii TaxID=5486 RepID=A0A367YKF1_9ASCO|nr:Cytochrome c oxidase protein 20, mitochondrial [Candida viswanathii]
MGWFGTGGSAPPSKVSVVSEFKDEAPAKPQQFLEDLPPKFEDLEPLPQQQQAAQPPREREATLMDAAKQIKLSDFTVDRFIHMPCFREAMITGFQAMGVLGVVTFLIHKNISKSFNWSVGGFFLGNVIGWEQCRSLRRRSFHMVEQAKLEREEKNRKKWSELQNKGDEDLKKFQEFNSREQ